jgi:hypothetical protein
LKHAERDALPRRAARIAERHVEILPVIFRQQRHSLAA